jgi:hypothetical protein
MKATAPFAFRYQYLSGGANTGNGWATWNANGDFATFYIQDSVASSIIPVFTYYMLLQSTPGGGAESDADFANLNNTATMTAYFNDHRRWKRPTPPMTTAAFSAGRPGSTTRPAR